MSFDYARSKATADRLISRFGQTATLRRPTVSGTAYNPSAGTPTDYSATVVVLDYDRREIDGTRILAADRKVLLAAGTLAIEPVTSDKAVIGGIEHSIIDVAPLNPGGTVLLYQLQVRR
jgi:hypothetical protein